MSTDPDQIRAQIEQTRSSLSTDVNTLAETVSPGNVARRQVDKVRSAAGSAKDKVMGTASNVGADGRSAAGSATSALGDAASSSQEAVKAAPDAVKARTQGNPLAAGLIAFGAGWLVASLIPASQPEQAAAKKLKDNASAVTGPLSDAGKEVADNLKEPAQQAFENVKTTAQDAAGTVTSEGTSAAQDVRDQGIQAKDAVQESRA
jgi:Protein of unknown function (DUF3618)